MNFARSFRKCSRSLCSRIETARATLARRLAARREQGWALISVLWTVAMLSMMAAATQDLTVTSVRTERRAQMGAHLDAALDAAVVRAIVALDDARVSSRWRIDGTPQRFSYGGVDMQVSIQDEDGKVDINEVDDDTLIPLFQNAGLDLKSATALADRIIEWHTQTGSVDEHTLNGGTDADYAARGLSWRPRHEDFQTVDEVQLVIGMTPALFARVRDSLTVYSHNDSPDPNVASRQVLEATYPDDPSQVQKLMSQRDGLSLGNGTTTPSQALVATGSDMAGRAFGIVVDAHFAGRHLTRRAVVELTGDGMHPYLVENWE